MLIIIYLLYDKFSILQYHRILILHSTQVDITTTHLDTVYTPCVITHWHIVHTYIYIYIYVYIYIHYILYYIHYIHRYCPVAPRFWWSGTWDAAHDLLGTWLGEAPWRRCTRRRRFFLVAWDTVHPGKWTFWTQSFGVFWKMIFPVQLGNFLGSMSIFMGVV